eukprot:GHVT01042926.1.p1 GENE.GHVT01042926.1~~GHVT01042926.1.p1  ORF type:complete len:219 (-),score=16.87 GHVT01042926.1:458-1114(-)
MILFWFFRGKIIMVPRVNAAEHFPIGEPLVFTTFAVFSMIWRHLGNSEVELNGLDSHKTKAAIYLVTFKDPTGYVVVASEPVKPYKGKKQSGINGLKNAKLLENAKKLADENGYIVLNDYAEYSNKFSYAFGVIPKTMPYSTVSLGDTVNHWDTKYFRISLGLFATSVKLEKFPKLDSDNTQKELDKAKQAEQHSKLFEAKIFSHPNGDICLDNQVNS